MCFFLSSAWCDVPFQFHVVISGCCLCYLLLRVILFYYVFVSSSPILTLYLAVLGVTDLGDYNVYCLCNTLLNN